MILRHENLNRLLEIHHLHDFDPENAKHLELLNQISLADIGENKGSLSTLPPFERHPYLKTLDAIPNITGLMIGTFPPITYIADHFGLPKLSNGKQRMLQRPAIAYFHGNKNSLWKFSPFNFQSILNHIERDKKPSMITKALYDKNIMYTDMILYCQRELKHEEKKNGIVLKYTASDTALHNIVLNKNVFDFLLKNTAISRLYFTNSFAFGMGEDFFTRQGLYNLKKRDAFQLFLKGADINGFKIEVALPDNKSSWLHINEFERPINELDSLNRFMRTKVHIKMRLSRLNSIKIYDLVFSVSPSAIGGNRTKSESNPCVIKYSKENKVNIKESCEGLIRQSLKAFFNNNLKTLTIYNA